MGPQEKRPPTDSAKDSANGIDHSESADSPDILDWDACIETPPPRPSGTIKVRLHFRGRDEPIPIDGPWEDQTGAS
jgi:hypothetical protein